MLFELTRPVRHALSTHTTLDQVESWLKLSTRPDGSFGETWLVLTPRYLLLGDAHSFSAPAFERLLREDVVSGEVSETGSVYTGVLQLRSGEQRAFPLGWLETGPFTAFVEKVHTTTAPPEAHAKTAQPPSAPSTDVPRSGGLPESRGMPCLKCGHWTDVIDLDDVEVERCPRCGGIYLDRSELDVLASAPGLNASLVRDSSRCHACHCALHDAETSCPACRSDCPSVHCPKCTATMRHVLVGDVVVELCTDCHGIWLDRGELDEIRTWAPSWLQRAPTAPLPHAPMESAAPLPRAGARPILTTTGAGVACLTCSTATEALLIGRTEVDFCRQCGGLFLDRGELEQLTGEDDLAHMLAHSEPRCPSCHCMVDVIATQCPACGREVTPVTCPRCHASMRRVLTGDVVVEHCRECGGLWLDRGELNKIDTWLRTRGAATAAHVSCTRCGVTIPDPAEGYFSGDGVVCHRCIRQIDLEDSERFAAADRAFSDGQGRYATTDLLSMVRQLTAWFQGRDNYWSS